MRREELRKEGKDGERERKKERNACIHKYLL